LKNVFGAGAEFDVVEGHLIGEEEVLGDRLEENAPPISL
jgi:hypothetical protein